jgi:hypothetical protein
MEFDGMPPVPLAVHPAVPLDKIGRPVGNVEMMEGAVKLLVHLRVSVETGKRWGDFH